ncbi:MAG: hypothetical protein CME64_00005 [Halobacteriovoraceae bacterium]|nr:hypothetical protein [Halobacteriovoraceae bacterium]
MSSELDGTTAVTSIVATDRAFAAIRADGSVVTWGDSSYGGDSSSVSSELDGTTAVTSITAASGLFGGAFAAIRADGSVVTWGNSTSGGDSSAVSSQLDGTTAVTTIYATGSAFAAFRTDGSVVTWGDSSYGKYLGYLKDFAETSTSYTGESNFCGKDFVGRVFCWGSSTTSIDPQLVGRQF